MFQSYSGFCNMQMIALWRHLLNTVYQAIYCSIYQVMTVHIGMYHSYYHSCKVSVQSTYCFRRYSTFTELVRLGFIRYLICIFLNQNIFGTRWEIDQARRLFLFILKVLLNNIKIGIDDFCVLLAPLNI